jgi:hypothetical protein
MFCGDLAGCRLVICVITSVLSLQSFTRSLCGTCILVGRDSTSYYKTTLLHCNVYIGLVVQTMVEVPGIAMNLRRLRDGKNFQVLIVLHPTRDQTFSQFPYTHSIPS